MRKLSFLLRAIRFCFRYLTAIFTKIRFRIMLFINNVEYDSISSNGLPYFCVGLTGKCIIGKNFHLNNGLRFNPIGYPQPCTIYVNENAVLTIGDNVGISQASIICHHCIEIQNNVKIGGGKDI